MKDLNRDAVSLGAVHTHTHTHTQVFYRQSEKGGSLFITSSFYYGAKEEVESN